MGQVIHVSGTFRAVDTARAADFPPPRAPTNPGAAATAPGFLLRRFKVLAHFSRDTRPGQYPPTGKTAGAAWRNPIGACRSGLLFLRERAAKVRSDASPHVGSDVGSAPGRRFFPESEAQSLTVGPRLPHHRRHPMTADEACAGILAVTVVLIALGYLAWAAL